MTRYITIFTRSYIKYSIDIFGVNSLYEFYIKFLTFKLFSHLLLPIRTRFQVDAVRLHLLVSLYNFAQELT